MQKKLLEYVINEKINKEEVKKMFNNIAEDANKLNKLEPIESRKKMLPIFKQLEEVFRGSETDDKADDKTDNESANDQPDNEQPDTTDMPELESEESAEQRKTKGQGLKILTPQKMLSRLPISLAQLKAENNSEKLKKEIRQLLYSLYRYKKLSKTIYEHLINAI